MKETRKVSKFGATPFSDGSQCAYHRSSCRLWQGFGLGESSMRVGGPAACVRSRLAACAMAGDHRETRS